MQSIVHFLLSIGVGLAMGLHLENKIKKATIICLLALAATCIDLDHFFPIYQKEGIKIFHNIFFFVIIPVALFLASCFYERGKGKTIKQRACVLLCVMFVGHMFLDGISNSGLPLFYPFRSDRFMMGQMGFALNSPIFSLTSKQMLMLIWGVMIFVANILETMIYNDVEGRRTLFIEPGSQKAQAISRKNKFPKIFDIMPFSKPHAFQGSDTNENAVLSNENSIVNDEMVEYIFNFVDNLPNRP